MAQENWWDSDPVAKPAGSAAPRPGPVYGAPPKPDKPDTPKTSYRTLTPAEVKARGLDPATVYQISSEGSVTAVSGQKNADKPTEYQSKSAGFLGRMLSSERQFSGVPADSRDARTVPGQWLHDTMPSVDATFNSSDRISADNASRDFIAASLRQESGAAIGKDEYENQYRIFYPMPGDTEQQIREKERARAQAIEGFKIAAGPLADEAMGTVKDPVNRATNDEGDADGINGRAQAGVEQGPDDRTKVATGSERFVADKEVNDTLFSMFQQGKSYDEMKSYAATRGYNLGPYNKNAFDAARKGGWSPFNPAGRTEKQSLRQRAAATPLAGYAGGATNALTLGLSDELYGAANAAAGGDYEQSRDEFQGAKRAIADMNPISDFAGNITGGALLGGGGVGGASKLGPGGQLIANAVRANPVKSGIGAGAAYGAGETNDNRLGGAAIGGLGGAMGGVLGKYVVAPGVKKAADSRIGQAAIETVTDGINKFRSRRVPALPENIDVEALQAGQRQNIPMRAPDIDPTQRNAMAAAEASPYGGGVIDNALRKDALAVERRLSEIGGPGESMVGDEMNYKVGSMGRKISGDYIERTRLKKNDLYGEAEQLAAGQRIMPEKAVQAAAQEVAELEAAGTNTNKALIGYIRGLGEDLSKGEGFSINEFQRLRSSASSAIKGDQALTVTDADRRLGNIVRAFTEDAGDQLPEGAAAKLAEADQFFAQRQGLIDGTLKKLIGTRGKPASPEDVGKRLVAMTRNRADHDDLKRIMAEANPEQKADFAATIAENMARGKNGEFSLGALATNISKTPGNVRKLVFGKEANEAFSDLQAIARAKSDTAGGLNTSKSGVVAVRQILSRGLLTATVAGGSTGSLSTAIAAPLITEMVTAIGQRRTAKILLNPKVTKWIRQAPKEATPAQARAYVEKLADALEGNAETAGVVSNVIPLFEQRLMGSAAQSPLRAAASEQENN